MPAKVRTPRSPYSLTFAKTLIDAAEFIVEREFEPDEARAVLYLSLVASEITLKAMLARAGWSAKLLKKHGHDMKALLGDLCQCEIDVGYRRPASQLLSVTVDHRYSNATVGTLLQAEGASRYPNEIRYGGRVYHYPPTLMLKAAKLALAWANEHFETVRKRRAKGK